MSQLLRTSRKGRVNICLWASDLARIDDAAKRAGLSRSDYMTQAAITRCRQGEDPLPPARRRKVACYLRQLAEDLEP